MLQSGTQGRAPVGQRVRRQVEGVGGRSSNLLNCEFEVLEFEPQQATLNQEGCPNFIDSLVLTECAARFHAQEALKLFTTGQGRTYTQQRLICSKTNVKCGPRVRAPHFSIPLSRLTHASERLWVVYHRHRKLNLSCRIHTTNGKSWVSTCKLGDREYCSELDATP